MTTHSRTLKLCFVGDHIRDFNNGLVGQHFRNEIGLGFLIEPALKSSPNGQNVTLVQKRVNTPTQVSSQILKP